ncbi:MAG: MBL fold metallo-hydrolase, partial [Dehalococcoidia bacterium]|nr:MBL fold metallo-hydrolase [Dehalococcoidia bacterium]
LRAVQPQVAVFSAGKGNPYGHPHPETIARFNKMNIPLYGTDINGTIIISTNGRSYNITTEK